MFNKIQTNIGGREAIVASGLCDYSLRDTLECGQCFRFVKISETENGEKCALCREYPEYVEYMVTLSETLVFVAQRNREELIFYGVSEREFDEICVPYFALDRDYEKIKNDVLLHTESDFLKNAVASASGIRILKQDPWETLFSFIISQNNNIPRIKKIIRAISAEYGENLAEKRGITICPKKNLFLKDKCEKLDTGACLECGFCYSFPSAEAVYENPEKLLPSHPGFRYKYLVDAAEKVAMKEIVFDEIIEKASYDFTLSELMKVKGVGEKVASCTSLFAFSNLEAFPIDVWMKRAIDEYFDGNLDPKTLGKYAGVAQQYIFHYIRQLSEKV